MTVVAYRNGIMAADSLTTLDDVCLPRTRKIETRNGYLFGLRGESCPTLAEVMDWVFEPWEGKFAIDRGYLPPFRGDSAEVSDLSFTILLVDPQGRVFELDQAGGLEWVPCGYHAIGSGSKYALGAMDYSRTVGAIGAVRAGIKRSAHCRPPIFVRRLDAPETETWVAR